MSISLSEAKDYIASGMLLAQAGSTNEALQLVRNVRELFFISGNADLSVEVMVLEGICEIYGGELETALDRLERAAAIASSFGSGRAVGLAVAWKSLCEFNLGRHLKSAESILLAHKNIQDLDSFVRFRVASMTSMLFEYSGDRPSSVYWFRLARVEASRCDNPSLLSALIYNIAMLRVGSRAIAGLYGESLSQLRSDDVDFSFVQSSWNYDLHSGSRLQVELHDLVKAQLFVSDHRFEEAVSCCRAFLKFETRVAAVNAARAKICLSWSLAKLGADPGDIRCLDESLKSLMDADDLALAHDKICYLNEKCGDLDMSSFHRLESDKWLLEFSRIRGLIRELLLSNASVDSPALWGVGAQLDK
jgi:tetratricopeptide (TPR) repeat protein